jgi:gas vesicle protein
MSCGARKEFGMDLIIEDRVPMGFATGVIFGALLGALATLWLAPQSGKKTQQLIHRQALRMQQAAEDALDDIKDGAERTSEDVREKVSVARKEGKSWLNQRADQASNASAKIRDAVAR